MDVAHNRVRRTGFQLLEGAPRCVLQVAHHAGRQFDLGLAWVSFPDGYGGLGLAPGIQREIDQRLARGPVRLGVFVQLAGAGDDVTDASVAWPEDRQEGRFGTITLMARVDDNEPERRKIIFDPVPRVDGIDSSGDPRTEVRSELYLLSGRRRRAAVAK